MLLLEYLPDLGFLFRGDRLPCLMAADSNDDNRVDLADSVWTVNYLFRGGPRPPHPFPGPGFDNETPGDLSCLQ